MTGSGHDPKNKLGHDRDPGRVKVPEYLLYIFRNSVMTRARVIIFGPKFLDWVMTRLGHDRSGS